jgi:hypothetical protein
VAVKWPAQTRIAFDCVGRKTRRFSPIGLQ